MQTECIRDCAKPFWCLNWSNTDKRNITFSQAMLWKRKSKSDSEPEVNWLLWQKCPEASMMRPQVPSRLWSSMFFHTNISIVFSTTCFESSLNSGQCVTQNSYVGCAKNLGSLLLLFDRKNMPYRIWIYTPCWLLWRWCFATLLTGLSWER